MNVILLGAPGAGKGTQSSLISETYGICHISTGDIFRKNIKEGTELGREAKGYIDRGQLVPDELTVRLVDDRIAYPDCDNGCLFDGFPRTVAQAKALSNIAQIDLVINIDVALDKLMRRLTGRRVCARCGESFHVDFLNGSNVCTKCGGELTQRKDDNEETVQNRLDVYVSQTEPLIAFYEKAGLLRTVNGSQDVEKVFSDIKKIISEIE